MKSRLRFLITAAFLCHLLLSPGLVTSQLPPDSVLGFALAPGDALSSAAALPDDPQLASPSSLRGFGGLAQPGEEVVIKAREQEKAGDIFTLRGDVEITFRSFVLRGEQMVYDSKSGEVTAEGNLSLDGGPYQEHLTASHGSYDLHTGTGKFYDVNGTVGFRLGSRGVTLTSLNPFAFTGKMVEKTGPVTYVVHNGTVTSCELPRPKWTFNAARIVVELDGKARIYNGTFRIKGAPILYLPYASHPVEPTRQSGLLMPTFGYSNRKGAILGDSVYLVLNRSADATLGAEWWARRGWAQRAEFRARPSETSYINLTFFGVVDREGFGPAHIDQGGQDVRLSAEEQFAHGIRGVADIDYLSSFVFRLAFNETFTQAVNSEVKSVAFLSKDYRGFFFNTRAARYQNFQSTVPGDLVTILHMPGVEISSVDRRIGGSPFYWAFDVAAEGVARHEPQFSTAALVGRFDAYPRASLPLVYHGWTFLPEAGLRETYYTERRLPTSGIGTVSDQPVNRRAFEGTFELRPPALGRIYERSVHGHRLKHVVEPRAIFRYVNGVENLPNIIRFDSRDILSNTSEVEYAVVNRLYAKPVSGDPDAGNSGSSREILSWELAQKYFINDQFGGAVVNGKRNVFTTTVDFTGVAFLTEPRRLSPLVSRLRIQATPKTDIQWQVDYDFKHSRINSSTTLVDYRIGDFFVGGSHAFLHVPGEIFVNPTPLPAPDKFNQFRFLAGYGGPNKRGFSLAGNVGFDANFRFLQYGAFQSSYNWDCCGFSFEYRRFAFGSVRNENQYRFAFTLANIGTAGTIKRQERLF
jgi:LPS-assembly protein